MASQSFKVVDVITNLLLVKNNRKNILTRTIKVVWYFPNIMLYGNILCRIISAAKTKSTMTGNCQFTGRT